MDSRAAMAKTLTSAPNKRERGVALLEAVMALALVSILAGATYAIFSQSAAATARANAKLEALVQVETALELASSPAFLARALEDGDAEITGEGWRVSGAPYDNGGEGQLALIRLTASAGPAEQPILTLETLRAIPR